jgi:GMP synthase-like glutamine amidotransferase
MHIAVLMTNTDESAFAARWPKDGEKFRALIHAVRPDWRVTVYAVKDGHFPADPAGYDGFIITGSPASVHDLDPWVPQLFALIRAIVAAGVPLYGACFGHQAIAMALGGRVERNPKGWVLGRIETFHADAGGEPRRMSLYAAHAEQVTALPPGAVALGGNEDCPFGSFALGDRVLTTQYHPEMSPDFIAALVNHLTAYLPEEVIARARESLTKTADTETIRAAIVSFFERGFLPTGPD